MISISYGVAPGNIRTGNFEEGTTIASLLAQVGLEVPANYELRVQGSVVPQGDWGTYVLEDGNAAIFAAQVKGNDEV